MAIRHKNLAIRRDELTVLKVSVAEWEVPLLQLVHGEEMVTVEPGEPWADRDPPDVSDEYQRLYAKYKTPAEESGAPGQRAVVLVYGAFGASPLLRQAIQAATFERKTDLLGLEAASKAADEVAVKAREKLALAQAASADDEDEDEEDEPEVPAVKVKAPKKAKAANTPATSLL